MKNKKTAIICSLLFTACFLPGMANASALNANADPVPALQISDEPYTPPAANTGSPSQAVGEDSLVPPPASFAPAAPATTPAPAPTSQLPEIRSADASQTPALQISDEPYVQASSRLSIESQRATPTANAKTLQAWVDNNEPRKVAVKSATAQPPAPVVTKAPETVAWSPASTAPAVVIPATPQKTSVASATPPAHEEHYKQAVATLQQQVDKLAQDNAALQDKLKASNSAKPTPIPVASGSEDFFQVKASRNVTIPVSELAALPPIEATEPKIPADVQKQLDNLKAQNTALQAKVRALDSRKSSSYAPSASSLDDISPASGDTPDEIALPKRGGKKFASLGDIDTEESYLEARRAGGLASDVEPGAPNGKDFAKLLSRYRQSEAENAKLGEMVKSSKDQCDVEKQQLEAMLFDPKIAEEQQRDYVADLEKQLSDAQAANTEQKRHYELQIRLLKKKVGKHPDL